MQALNQRCNALTVINGIFLHSCNTSEKAIQALAHMGVSISSYTINNAVRSLSQHSAAEIHALGRTLLAGYAYDNFDVAINTMTPTVEKSTESLLHLTSGLVLQLDHGVSTDDQ